MSLAILRADRSRAKWRLKLKDAFEGKVDVTKLSSEPTAETGGALSAVHKAGEKISNSNHNQEEEEGIITVPQLSSNGNDLSSPASEKADGLSTSGSNSNTQQSNSQVEKKTWIQKIRHIVLSPSTLFASKGTFTIFIIPFVTTLREGLEGVVYVGGVSLGLPAKSIPLPAIVGILVGLGIGIFLWKGGSFGQIRAFLILSTCFLLIIAAGMASRSIYYLQFYGYVQKVGDGAAGEWKGWERQG